MLASEGVCDANSGSPVDAMLRGEGRRSAMVVLSAEGSPLMVLLRSGRSRQTPTWPLLASQVAYVRVAVIVRLGIYVVSVLLLRFASSDVSLCVAANSHAFVRIILSVSVCSPR